MANKLKIYACSGVGSVAKQPKGYDYWTDNTSSISNTQAVNTLLSIINLNNAEVLNLKMAKASQIDKLNTIDFCVVCLDAAQRFALDDERLVAAGRAIGAMCDERLFQYESTNNSNRDKHLDGLLATFDYYVQAGKTGGDDDFWAWWNENVQSRNRVGLTTSEQDAVRSAIKKGVSGIGASQLNWQDNAELSQYLNKASEYFLYLYFTEDDLKKLPHKFGVKRRYQEQVYNYCKGLFVKQFGSEEEMQNIIRTGIIGYFHKQPEEVCAAIVSGNYKGEIGPVELVGTITIKELIEIILICAAIVLAIVTMICDAAVKAKTVQYQSLNQQIIDAATPQADDFDGLETSGFSKKTDNWVTVGIIVAGLIFLLKK